jgi:hypothetical protein
MEMTGQVNVVVNQDNIYHIMFTTDISIIHHFIGLSPYSDMIDANIILRLNQKAAELSMDEFRGDPDILGPIEFDMLLRFQNIVDKNPTIKRILRKRRTTEWDELELINWNLSNHAFYCDQTKPPRPEPVVMDDEEYIL